MLSSSRTNLTCRALALTLVLASPGIHSLAAHANFSKDRKDCVVSNAPTQKLVAPNIAEVRDTTVISCPTTTAAGPAVDGRPRQGSRSGYAPTYGANDVPPATEQPCRTLYAKQPAVITYGPQGAELDWLRPDGVADAHVNGDMPSAPTPSDGLVPLDYAVSVAGQNHLFVWYKPPTGALTDGSARGDRGPSATAAPTVGPRQSPVRRPGLPGRWCQPREGRRTRPR